MSAGLFVTGTDTGVGKTLVSCALLARWRAAGWRTAAMKPVAAGCRWRDGGWRNDDALALATEATERRDYALVNPVALEAACAPHLAAAEQGVALGLDELLDAYQRLAAGAQRTLVEGAGGWRVPLGPQHTLAGLPARLGLPVLLVVGVRLGCLNHALLTAEAVHSDGLTLAGWVANVLDPQDPRAAAQVETLARRIGAPLAGVLPYLRQPAAAAAAPYLEPDALLGFGG